MTEGSEIMEGIAGGRRPQRSLPDRRTADLPGTTGIHVAHPVAGGYMEKERPTPRDQYPERDTVEDRDRPIRNGGQHQREPRKNEDRGNRRPEEEPGFGQGA
jgi:hypothetical protein